MTGDEIHGPQDENRVIEELQDNEPLTTDELSARLDLERDEVGEIASDLVVGNKASVNSRREYKLL